MPGAGVLMAGALTTGIGSRLVSTADAQPPAAEPSPEAIKKALDYLRSHQAQDRWEYKFVPVDKTLTAADLQKLLTASDREGWEYCGTQDLADAKARNAATPHMVFKRPRAGARASTDAQSATAAGLAALAESLENAKRAEASEKEAKRLADQERYFRSIYEAQLKAAEDARRQREKNAAEQDRLNADDAKKKAAAADTERERKHLQQQHDRAIQPEQEIQELRRDYEALIARLKHLEDLRKATGNRTTETEPAATRSLSLPLQHVNVDDALKAIDKVYPAGGFKAQIDTRTNTLTIHGPPETLAKLKELIEKTVDVKPTDATSFAAEKPEIAIIMFKHIDAKTAQDAIKKGLGSTASKLSIAVDQNTNSVIIAGSPDALRDARKVVDSIDRPRSGERK